MFSRDATLAVSTDRLRRHIDHSLGHEGIDFEAANPRAHRPSSVLDVRAEEFSDCQVHSFIIGIDHGTQSLSSCYNT